MYVAKVCKVVSSALNITARSTIPVLPISRWRASLAKRELESQIIQRYKPPEHVFCEVPLMYVVLRGYARSSLQTICELAVRIFRSE
jgi:hypothetical protein